MIKKNKFNCVFLSLNIVIVSKNLKKLTNNVSLSNEKIYKHSWCVHVRWNPLEHNPSRPVETRRNPFRLTRLNPSKHVTTCRKHVQTCWNTFPVDPMNFLFYIFIFLYFYIFSPLFSPPPQFPPFIPIFFLFGGGEGGGRGGERAGDGDGTGGEPPPPPPAGRSVAPPPKGGRPPSEGGGDKVPPPFSIKQKKQTKFTNQTTYLL